MARITNNFLERTPLLGGECEVCDKPCEDGDATCSMRCEATLLRREAKQGAQIMRVLKKWRKFRGRKGTPGEGAITEAAALVDRFLKEDRELREAAKAARKKESEDAVPAPAPE